MDQDIDAQFNNALRLRSEGRIAEAQAILEHLCEVDPRPAAVFAILGDLYHDQGLFEKAIQATRKATVLAPSSELASLGLFHSLWDSDLRDEAFEEMKRFMICYNDKASRYRVLLADLKAELQ